MKWYFRGQYYVIFTRETCLIAFCLMLNRSLTLNIQTITLCREHFQDFFTSQLKMCIY